MAERREKPTLAPFSDFGGTPRDRCAWEELRGSYKQKHSLGSRIGKDMLACLEALPLALSQVVIVKMIAVFIYVLDADLVGPKP